MIAVMMPVQYKTKLGSKELFLHYTRAIMTKNI